MIHHTNKQPSGLEITLEDAPRVYHDTDEDDQDFTTSGGATGYHDSMALIHASQSAYRHLLPRKGQPG